MHFAFILKCKFKDGRLSHYVWQRNANTRKQAEKEVMSGFQQLNVFAYETAIEKQAELIEMTEAGEANENSDNSHKLYEAACAKAAKMDSKALASPSSLPAQVNAGTLP